MPKLANKLNQIRISKLDILVFLLLVGPFYLNDFASIFVKQWQLWLCIDYVAVKLFPLLVILWLIQSKKMKPTGFGFTTQTISLFFGVFLIVAIAGTIIDQNGYRLLEKLPGYPSLGGMPVIENTVWNWIDLTLGLLLVGVVEELVFRGYMHTFLRKFTKRWSLIVVVSAVIFGFIHWSLGFHAVLITALIGAFFMMVYLYTRALPPIMLAHFVINFTDFSGVVDKSIFKVSVF